MPIQEIVGYLVAVSLPIWLAIEELAHRRAPRADERRLVVRDETRVPRPAPMPAR